MKIINLFFLFALINYSSIKSMVICTATNSKYFKHTLGLIGSIHKNSYTNLVEIMVFDLGLSPQEKKRLNAIKKTNVYTIEKTHPHILNIFQAPQGYQSLGWFAWKPVVIKQALDKHDTILWLDAGNTVLRSLQPIFNHIQKNGYLICTIGDEKDGHQWKHPIKWGATQYIIDKFNLDTAENRWILGAEFIDGSLIGASKNHASYTDYFLPLYKATYDLRNFADDGTSSGVGRHDQTYMSALGYLQGKTVLQQEHTQTTPMLLDGHEIFTTWNPNYVDERTAIYHSRSDLYLVEDFAKYLKYRKTSNHKN